MKILLTTETKDSAKFGQQLLRVGSTSTISNSDDRHHVLRSFRFLGFLAITFVVILTFGIGIHKISEQLTLNFANDVQDENISNRRPIIGILAQEYYDSLRHNGRVNSSYIAASYVKFVEGAGCRVVPIMINRTQGYYDGIFQGINGLLLPGGGVYFNDSGYAKAAKYFMMRAREANANGDHFPIWGTCLGFEYFVYEALGDKDVLEHCDANNISTTLQFTDLAKTSHLYKGIPPTILQILKTQPVASNFHSNCLTRSVLQKYKLEDYNILSWSSEISAGSPFVSSMESKTYPFYGVQFHPEKNMYEWSWKKNIPHSSEAVLAGQYFAQFLANEARKSRHNFGSYEIEERHLIYNYAVTYTGGISGDEAFEQKYFFPIEQI